MQRWAYWLVYLGMLVAGVFMIVDPRPRHIRDQRTDPDAIRLSGIVVVVAAVSLLVGSVRLHRRARQAKNHETSNDEGRGSADTHGR